MITFPRCLLLVLVCLGVGLLPTAALGKPAHRRSRESGSSSWSAPQLLGTSALPPGLAFGEAGVAVGMAADGSSLTIWTHHGIHARGRSASGRLGPDQLITANAASDGTLAVAPNGTAVIVWAVKRGDQQYETLARVRSADGRLGPVCDLGGQLEELLGVTYGPSDGRARFIWAQNRYQPSAVASPGRFVAALGDAGGLLTPMQLDDPAQNVNSTDLIDTFSAAAVNAAGDVLIVWLDQDHQELSGRVLSHSGILGPILRIGGSAGAELEPQVALSPNGTGYVVWGSVYGLQVRQVNLNGTRGPAIHLSLDSGIAAAVTSFGDGRAVVAWTEGYTDPIMGRIVSRSHVGPPLHISGSQGQDPWLVADGRQAVVVWSDVQTITDKARGPSARFGFQSRTISERGALGKPAVLFPNSGRGSMLEPWSVAVAGNAKGQVVASWLVQNYRPSPHHTVHGISVLEAGRR